MSDIEESNPHILWKQLFGLVVASAIFFFFGGPLVVLTGIVTFCDAWVSGIYKKKDVKSALNISPMGWGVVMEGLMIVAYPVYLLKRNKLKTKGENNVFWILTIIFGALSLGLSITQIVIKLQYRG